MSRNGWTARLLLRLQLLDLIGHLWIPVVVIGTAATAGTIRVMRATVLDELGSST